MPRPAVFLDRDNTLIVNDGYLGDPDLVELLPGASAAIAKLRRLGYAIVTVSNQSGVGRGYLSEDDVRAVNRRMDELLKAGEGGAAAVVDRHYFCPFHPEAAVAEYRRASPLRKPEPGMLLAAARDLDLDLTRSWLIGDAGRDVEAGRRAGLGGRTILLTDPDLPPSEHAADKNDPDHEVTSLTDAAAIIAGAPPPPPPPAPAPAASVRDAVGDTVPLDADDEQTDLLRQIAQTLRHPPNPAAARADDFSLAALLGGVAQVLALATLFLAYLLGDDPATRTQLLLAAVFVQLLTLTLLTTARR